MTSERALGAIALAATLMLAAASWVVVLRQTTGMDMGSATDLGSFASFIGYWMPMMAAMMLPGAAPAVVRRGRVQSMPLFVGSYLAVWTLVGLAVYAVYRPHGALAAGALTVTAGLYELTWFKRACRRRCQEQVCSGAEFGLICVGSSIGLMLIVVALGVMSITWMSLIAALVLAQKLLPEHRAVDLPVAVAIVALGVAVTAEL